MTLRSVNIKAVLNNQSKDFAGQLTSLENLAELLSSTYSKYNNVCKTLPNPNICPLPPFPSVCKNYTIANASTECRCAIKNSGLKPGAYDILNKQNFFNNISC